MKLTEYLDKKKMTVADLARALDVPHETARRYVNGMRRPEWSILRRIKEITGGSVEPNDFLPTDEAA